MGYPKRYSGRQPSDKFGQYLVRLRENAEFSQVEAARRLGLTPTQLNYYEKGTRVASEGLLTRLARLYRVSTAEVLERAYWPQLILLPLIAIIYPEQLTREYIEEIEKGLEDAERQELTQRIKKLLSRRIKVNQQ